MKILILGLNYAPEPVGVAVYTAGLSETLAAGGDDVRVIAGQPFYPDWVKKPGVPARAVENGVWLLRLPHYVPARPTGLRRILHQVSFAASALFPMLHQALVWRPDAVIAIAPALMSAPVARLAALCGARSWLHVHDLEVEAAFSTGLVSRNGLAARAALAFERMTLRAFGRVSSISPQMCRRIVQKGVPAERVHELRNWADLELVHPLDRPSRYWELWRITTPHVALYSGNLANKQGMEIVLEAARALQHRDDLTFVICGEGPRRRSLETEAADLANIQFRDLQPREHLGELLGLATVHLLPQIADAADLVMPSKLGNMLASGRPVVATAAPGTGLADELSGRGTVVPPGDAAAFAAAIVTLVDDPALRLLLGAAACSRAEQHWNREAIVRDFARELYAQHHAAQRLRGLAGNA